MPSFSDKCIFLRKMLTNRTNQYTMGFATSEISTNEGTPLADIGFCQKSYKVSNSVN